MSWERRLLDLFDDLEQQAEGLALAERDAEVAELGRAEYAEVELALPAARLGGEACSWTSRRWARVRGRLARVGAGWCLLVEEPPCAAARPVVRLSGAAVRRAGSRRARVPAPCAVRSRGSGSARCSAGWPRSRERRPACGPTASCRRGRAGPGGSRLRRARRADGGRRGRAVQRRRGGPPADRSLAALRVAPRGSLDRARRARSALLRRCGLGLGVHALDERLELAGLDPPLTTAAELERPQLTAPDQGSDLGERGVEDLGHVGQGQEPGSRRSWRHYGTVCPVEPILYLSLSVENPLFADGGNGAGSWTASRDSLPSRPPAGGPSVRRPARPGAPAVVARPAARRRDWRSCALSVLVGARVLAGADDTVAVLAARGPLVAGQRLEPVDDLDRGAAALRLARRTPTATSPLATGSARGWLLRPRSVRVSWSRATAVSTEGAPAWSRCRCRWTPVGSRRRCALGLRRSTSGSTTDRATGGRRAEPSCCSRTFRCCRSSRAAGSAPAGLRQVVVGVPQTTTSRAGRGRRRWLVRATPLADAVSGRPG